MRRNTLFYLFMAAIAYLWGGVILTSCESENKDDFVENNPPSSFMSFIGEDTLRSETRAVTATSIPSFGLSCSVYSSSGSASSAALGNYFFNKQLSNNTTTSYLWPGSSYKSSFYNHVMSDPVKAKEYHDIDSLVNTQPVLKKLWKMEWFGMMAFNSGTKQPTDLRLNA